MKLCAVFFIYIRNDLSVLKAIIKKQYSNIKNKLTFINFGVSYKYNIFATKVCYFGIVMQSLYNANFKFDQSVFAIYDSPLHISRSVRMTTHDQ